MIERTDFGRGPRGEPIFLYGLSSAGGLAARISNYGGIVTSLLVPDRNGILADVVLGFQSLSPYLERHPYFGAIVGRVAGRLTPGQFTVAGRKYALNLNDGPHHLHGGESGFDRRTWSPDIIRRDGREALRLSYLSRDGEEGYPGNAKISVIYSVTDDNALAIDYEATADRATPMSPTNHSYFDLNGEAGGDIRSHQFQIFAEEFTPIAADFSHTGRQESVAGSPADFRTPVALADRIGQIHASHGDNYLLGPRTESPRLAARVFEPESGRTMDVLTTEPCLQFYTGVNLDGSTVGKSGKRYGKFAGFCLECHGYPAAMSFAGFESIVLDRGGIYRQKTVYKFGASASRTFPDPSDRFSAGSTRRSDSSRRRS